MVVGDREGPGSSPVSWEEVEDAEGPLAVVVLSVSPQDPHTWDQSGLRTG